VDSDKALWTDFQRQQNVILLLPFTTTMGKTYFKNDYFLQSDELIETYITFDIEPLNSSTHNPILVKVSCEFDAMADPSEQIFVPKLRWDKIDKTLASKK